MASPESGSAIETAFELAAEKTSGVCCAVVCAAGTELTGASLTAVTVMLKVCGAEVFSPPSAVPPLSCRTKVTAALPLASGAGV
jgi:hypothetical protein